MTIYINNKAVELPQEEMTVAELADWRNFPSSGTAVAVNDRIVKKEAWVSHKLADGDRVTVISAAFGG